jgi:hypothetical protein
MTITIYVWEVDYAISDMYIYKWLILFVFMHNVVVKSDAKFINLWR